MSQRSLLLPKEHGAYAQLTFPLLSGLVVGGISLSGVCLALATVGFFLAYEPIVVLIGTRGARLQKDDAAAARLQLPITLVAAAGFGLLGLWTAVPTARLLLTIPVGFSVLVASLIPLKRVKTLAGEVLVLASFSSMHMPIAAAAHATGARIWGGTVVWFSVFLLATLCVHSIKARQKQRDLWLVILSRTIAYSSVAVVAVMMLQTSAARYVGLALILPLLAVAAMNTVKVHPRSLKRVGWAMVTANVISLILLAVL